MGIDGRLGCARDVYVHTIITSTRKLSNVRRVNGLSWNDVCTVLYIQQAYNTWQIHALRRLLYAEMHSPPRAYTYTYTYIHT
jgi:hypothetical protein